jgi:hypothetical protein
MYIVYANGWHLSIDNVNDYTYLSPQLIPLDGKFYTFDWDILVDITARGLVEDHHTHPRWVGPYRRHRYPQYTPNPRYVRNAAIYTQKRSAAILARQIILGMHLNINPLHIPHIKLVGSCYERWCVDITHLVPQITMPSSHFTIDFASPEAGRPANPLPVWEENKLTTRVPFTPEEREAEAKKVSDLLSKTIGYTPPENK